MMGFIVTTMILIPVFLLGIASLIFNVRTVGQMFTGELTNAEFRCMLDLIFEDPALRMNGSYIDNAEYSCRVIEGYYGLTINGVWNFTPYQKILFFKRLKKWKQSHLDQSAGPDPLNKAKLAEKVFQKQLDSMLEEE